MQILSRLLLLFFFIVGSHQIVDAQSLEMPEWIMTGVSYEIPVHGVDGTIVSVNGEDIELSKANEHAFIEYTFQSSDTEIQFTANDKSITYSVNPIPLWLSIIPPLLAILLALLTREVLTSLFLGIFSGSAIIGFYSNGIKGIWSGLLSIFDTYVVEAMADKGHISIIIFSMTIGSIVTLISKNGGMQGVVKYISRYAKDARSGQLATYVLGIAIFFDDYANTLVVGNTMRAVTDRLKVSREKLAYIVDSTAAPIAALAFVTTWIGAELGYIEEGVAQIPGLDEGAYSIFLNSLPYSYYPILTLIFILILIWYQRDFGPMLTVEKDARAGQIREGASGIQSAELTLFEPADNAPIKAYNAIAPIAVIIIGTMIGLVYTGWSAETWNADIGLFRKLRVIIRNSDSYVALMWSSICVLILAILMTVSQKIMKLSDTMEVVIAGYKTMVTAMMILLLAWSLASVTEHMETASFLESLWSPSISPIWLPAVTFILAALVSFSTGSSWGTMAILYPLLLPTAFSICTEAGYELTETLPIFYNLVSCILAGSVLGDHCSPISDTTILSSLAAGCNHISHVKTQMPYALTVGFVSITLGTIGTAMGLPNWIAFLIGIALCWLIVLKIGQKNEVN
jgi:Na+/H+ antiporter NhaC